MNVLRKCDIYGFPGGSVDKEFTCNAEDADSAPGSRRSAGEGHGNPLWHSRLEGIMDGRAWRAAVPGVAVRRGGQNEYCSALRKKEILSLTATWVRLEDSVLSPVSQAQKDTSCVVSLA